jgi:lactoylglutathione lyase/methylmalonyl-CoA/ethylmalonyl-CoA epimerase
MITKVDHIGIVVRSIEEAVKLYTEALGLTVHDIETVEAYKVRIAMIPVGDSKIELVEPTNHEGMIAKYIEKKGEGLHHLALEVDDIEAMLSYLHASGIPLIDEKPRAGAGGTRVAFLHTKGAKISLELVEPKK